MQIVIKGDTGCYDISFDNSSGDTGDNGDTYFITIADAGSQGILVDGEETDRVTIGIVGNWELFEFLDAMDTIRRLRNDK